MVNDFNQTALFFGSRKLINQLGLSSKPVNFVLDKQPQLPNFNAKAVDH